MGEWHQLEKKDPTWRCKSGHMHRGRRADGSPCTYKKPTRKPTKAEKKAERAKQRQQKQQPDYGELMGTRTERTKPARITGVVRGGLPGLGKRR
jgi:hypothetical protein